MRSYWKRVPERKSLLTSSVNLLINVIDKNIKTVTLLLLKKISSGALAPPFLFETRAAEAIWQQEIFDEPIFKYLSTKAVRTIYLDSVLANPSLPWHLEFQNDGKAKTDCSVSILDLSPGTSPSWGTSLSRALATCPWPSVSTSLGASCPCNRSWRSPVGFGT